ncbi:MAG: glycosyltransferase family 2 protein [Alphaproteobacteria bacterium]|nr:glycosyltransferase family 2 protein [Alphaproteobacteria bacterium]
MVIVNWNSGGQLRACLESIARSAPGDYRIGRVVVADNGSVDGSADHLDDIALPLAVLRIGANIGFGAACNRASAMGESEYLLLLNPDTRVEPDTLPRSLGHLAGSPEVGILGVRLVDERGATHRSCARFPLVRHFVGKVLGLDRLAPSLFHGHLMLEWPHGDSRVVDQVMGAFFLMPRHLFEQLDGFDERFFLYFEDVDFAWRARQLGRPCYFLADVAAYHKGGGTSEQVKPERIFYCLRSRIIYARKHFGWGRAATLTAVTILAEPLSRLALAVLRGSLAVVLDTVRAYRLLIADLPRILSTPLSGVRDARVAPQPVRPAERH